mgnify:CR=1 FL=1|jgi:DNA recombination protein RmuC
MCKCVNDINQSFSEEAKKFTLAIRGNIHAVGRFGEDTLQNIFDASGLNEGKDYLKQNSFQSEANGNLRPDFVLLVPNERGLILDSKLSLDCYMKYVETEGEEFKNGYATNLVKNINNHVSELSKKEYQNIGDFKSYDYVLMFVASDPALYLALSIDKELIRNSLKKGVLIVGPTTLMATIKTIEFLWREQKQVENFKELGITGKKLYEKCAHFVDRLKDTQKHFLKANESLETALNHLNRGNGSIVNEAMRLKELGISSEKTIKSDNKK